MTQPYTRIQVQYVRRIPKRGAGPRAFMQTSFSIPHDFLSHMEALKKLAETFGFDLDKDTEKRIEKAEREMFKEHDKPLFELTQRQQRVRECAGARRIDVERRYEITRLRYVLARVPYGDFSQLPLKIQQDLIVALEPGAAKDVRRRAYVRLARKGLRWGTYVPGDVSTLFPKQVGKSSRSTDKPDGDGSAPSVQGVSEGEALP